MSREIPILLSTPMVQATLAGRKTKTRRLSKLDIINENPNEWEYNETFSHIGRYERHEWLFRFLNKSGGSFIDIPCPYGKKNDLLYVRETWWKGETWNEADEVNTRKETILYRADTNDARPCDLSDEWCINEYGFNKRDWPSWKPSIHLPKNSSRIWLKVTDITVERLHDITDDDALAEGIERKIKFPDEAPNTMYYRDYEFNNRFAFGLAFGPKQSFKSLWRKINGVESWDANPWVWVISFEVVSTTGKPNSIDVDKRSVATEVK